MPTKLPRFRTVATRADGVFECGDATTPDMSRAYAFDAMQTKHGLLPGPGSGNGLLVPLANQITFQTFPI